MYMLYLDSNKSFQATITRLIKDIEGYKEKYPEIKNLRVSKRRLLASAAYVTYNAAPEVLYELMKTLNLNPSKDYRQPRNVPHKVIKTEPPIMDYVKAGMGRLNLEVLGGISKSIKKDIRLDERQYAHLAIYYYNSLGEAARVRALSNSIIAIPDVAHGRPKKKAAESTQLAS